MLKIFQQNLPTHVLDFCKKIHANGGEAWIVGGWVRDCFLKEKSVSDVDIEVFGLPYDVVKILCKPICKAEFPKFGVFKCEGMDLALPRIEYCIGKRYNSFKTVLLPNLSFRKAALRRDFTINALAWNPIRYELRDPFHGVNALKTKQLYPISKHFTEDASRVLRAAQLIARFGFVSTKPLLQLILKIKSPILSKTHIKRTLNYLNTEPCANAAWQFLEQISWAKFLK
jgi:tRNA nucleotidyltransferase (CCA-adding enzyme)